MILKVGKEGYCHDCSRYVDEIVSITPAVGVGVYLCKGCFLRSVKNIVDFVETLSTVEEPMAILCGEEANEFLKQLKENNG